MSLVGFRIILFLSVIVKVRERYFHQMNVMFWQNLSSSFIVNFSLFSTMNSTNCHFIWLVKEVYAFCVLSFTILNNKI